MNKPKDRQPHALTCHLEQAPYSVLNCFLVAGVVELAAAEGSEGRRRNNSGMGFEES
jgi:hypothetical protein